jgi:hypothetical protein
MNRRIPNGTYGGVRGRGLVTPSYSIMEEDNIVYILEKESKRSEKPCSLIIR